MADVTFTGIVNLKVTDVEWRLIMKALAHFAGVKIASSEKPEQRALAAELNKQLLKQRVNVLQQQLTVAEGALMRAGENDS